MAIGERPNGKTAPASSDNRRHDASSDGPYDAPADPYDAPAERRYNVVVALNYEQMAAAEGWRSAHGIANQAEAFGELIRLGLLSEVAKIYRMVCDQRAGASTADRQA